MMMQRRETLSHVNLNSSTDSTSSLNSDARIKSNSHLHLVDRTWDGQDGDEGDLELNVPLFSKDYVQNSSQSNNIQDNSHLSQINVDKYKEDMKKRRVMSRSSSILNKVIDRLQAIYLPKKVSSQLAAKILDQDSGALHPSGRVPLVRGLDKVANGSLPAADTVLLCGVKPLRYFWYMLSGVCCDCIQLGIDVCLFRAFHLTDPSLCWVLGFGLSIIFRHSFHRYLVFGAYVGGYWRSLMRMYGGYSVIIAISTIFNMVMTKTFHFSHYVAWITTLLWTGIVNYFILKHIWTFGGKASETAEKANRIQSNHDPTDSSDIV